MQKWWKWWGQTCLLTFEVCPAKVTHGKEAEDRV